MPTDSTSWTTNNWREAFPWLLLTQTPAIALRGRVMLLAAVGVLAVWGGDQLFHAAKPQAASPSDFATESWNQLSSAWTSFADPFVALSSGENLFANTIRCLLRIAVWGLIGGTILRIAALGLTRDESPDVSGALRYAWRNRVGNFGGPLLLVVGLAIVALPFGISRLAMQVSWLAPIGAILWPMMLVLSVLAAIYAIGMAIGWPLAYAAVATDKSDGFDAVSRMFAYVYQKPLRLVGYVAVVLGLGVLVGVAMQAFVTAVLYASGVGLGSNTSAWATSIVAWWESLFVAFAHVFFTAYLWASAAGIYLLRRQDIDGVHLDEVHIDESEFGNGRPELAKGPTGVPEVVCNDPSEKAA